VLVQALLQGIVGNLPGTRLHRLTREVNQSMCGVAVLRRNHKGGLPGRHQPGGLATRRIGCWRTWEICCKWELPNDRAMGPHPAACQFTFCRSCIETPSVLQMRGPEHATLSRWLSARARRVGRAGCAKSALEQCMV